MDRAQICVLSPYIFPYKLHKSLKIIKKVLTKHPSYAKIIEVEWLLWQITYICGCSSMVESQPSKLVVWVRFPSPAPLYATVAQLDRAIAF